MLMTGPRSTSLGCVFFLLACSHEGPATHQQEQSATAVVDAGAEPAEVFATVVSLQGEVVQGGRALVTGDPVAVDVPLEIRSGTAVLSIAGVGEVRVYPKSKLQLRSKSRVKLWLGKLWAIITPQAEPFAVETENAVAGVRGTRFFVARTTTGTRIAVQRGKVAVANSKKPEAEVLVGAGQQVTVDAERPPSDPAAFDANEDEQAWKDAAAAPSEGPAGAPTPKVTVDRKAFEVHEQQGEAKKEALRREAGAEKKALDDEEQQQRKSFEQNREGIEKDLEEQMQVPKQKAPKAAPTQPDAHKDEVKDFLQ